MTSSAARAMPPMLVGYRDIADVRSGSSPKYRLRKSDVDTGILVTNLLSAAAVVVSILSLAVSLAAHRAGGPRIVLTDTKLTNVRGEWWLEIRVANAGRGQVDLDGAWAGWLGATVTDLPVRLPAASSKVLIFRGRLPPSRYLGSSLTVQIGLGTGQVILKRVKLDEVEIGMARAAGRDADLEPSSPGQVRLPMEEV